MMAGPIEGTTMTLYAVPLTILTTVNVRACSADEARSEAIRFAESMDNSGAFVDGWNDVQRQSDGPTIDDVSSLSVEAVALDEVEEIDESVAVIEVADDLADVLERIVVASAKPDHVAFAAAMRDATDLLARVGVNVALEG